MMLPEVIRTAREVWNIVSAIHEKLASRLDEHGEVSREEILAEVVAAFEGLAEQNRREWAEVHRAPQSKEEIKP